MINLLWKLELPEGSFSILFLSYCNLYFQFYRSASSKNSSTSQSPKKSPTKSPIDSMLNNLSGLRQRQTLDDTDSGKLTPTPRRSIHSYKVSETTKQVITKRKDGTETRDVYHSIERTENGKAVEDQPSKKWSRTVVNLIKFILFVGILIAIYIAVINSKDGTITVEQIEDMVNSATSQVEEEVKENVPPPREEIPQGNIGDI